MSNNNNPNFFSNRDRNVFLLNMQSQLDRGALLSRYSRTANPDIRDLFDREFLTNSGRGKEFYEKIFLEYGDESVAELVTVQAGIQNVSNVAVKIIEESRIGLSYLEKSSRYVRYDKKQNGRFPYLLFENTGLPDKFEESYKALMESLFIFYEQSLDKITADLRERYPREQFGKSGDKIADKAYESALRARTLDDLRAILPASTLTNMGISGNARSFISLIQRLSTSGLKEASDLSDAIYSELEEDYGQIIRSARNKHGLNLIHYNKERNDYFAYNPIHQDSCCKLISYGKSNLDRLPELLGMSHTEKSEFIRKAGDLRNGRRDKLPRIFELVDLTYSLKMNYGIFREFQRHRFMGITRSPLGTSDGFQVPELIKKNPELDKRFNSLVEESMKLHSDLLKAGANANAAQYVLPFCMYYTVLVHTNLRELVYYSELRTTPHAHADIRKLSLEMVDQFLNLEKECTPIFKFLDRNEYPLGRYSQEYRKETKNENLQKDTK